MRKKTFVLIDFSFVRVRST